MRKLRDCVHLSVMNHFSEKAKMAELMGSDFDLLGVMTRMGIAFGFGDETVGEICRRYQLDPRTFLLICKLYGMDGYVPTEEDLRTACVQDVLQYLRNSHAYYMDVAVQSLAESLRELTAPCSEKQQRLIRKFFMVYQEELSKHFEYEEHTVFPYVDEVLEGRQHHGFSIGQYEENHSNVQEKLEDLKNYLIVKAVRYDMTKLDRETSELFNQLYNCLFGIEGFKPDEENA